MDWGPRTDRCTDPPCPRRRPAWGLPRRHSEQLKTPVETEFAAGHGDCNLAPLLEVVRGELVLASGGAQDSRAYFEKRPQCGSTDDPTRPRLWRPARILACSTRARAGRRPRDRRWSRASCRPGEWAATRWRSAAACISPSSTSHNDSSLPPPIASATFRQTASACLAQSCGGPGALLAQPGAQGHRGDVAGSKRDEEAAQRFLPQSHNVLARPVPRELRGAADLPVPRSDP